MKINLLRTSGVMGVISLPPFTKNETFTQNTRRASVECYLRSRRDRHASPRASAYWLKEARNYRGVAKATAQK